MENDDEPLLKKINNVLLVCWLIVCLCEVPIKSVVLIMCLSVALLFKALTCVVCPITTQTTLKAGFALFIGGLIKLFNYPLK